MMEQLAAARARRADIAVLHVFHLGTLLFTDVSLDGAALEARAETERFDVRDAEKIDQTLAKIADAAPEPTGDGYDARWGLVFATADGERVLAVYADAYGTAGTVDDVRVRFANPGIIDWLRNSYGMDFVLSA